MNITEIGSKRPTKETGAKKALTGSAPFHTESAKLGGAYVDRLKTRHLSAPLLPYLVMLVVGFFIGWSASHAYIERQISRELYRLIFPTSPRISGAK